MNLPQIIQGGMGAGVSSWNLARAVSSLGQLGVVSGTALDLILVRRLQDGDPGGHMRQALDAFPFREMAERIWKQWYIPGGKEPESPYRNTPMHSLNGPKSVWELCIAGNFAEVFLAKQGHNGPVGINYLEKIQMPHLPSLYGAMLAGVTVIIMGAGIAKDIPAAIESLALHQPATYPLSLAGRNETAMMKFDPADFLNETLAELERPQFLPIISSHALATLFLKRAKGPIDGFVIEGPTAGGHNAPPRGALTLDDSGQPIYGERDKVDLAFMQTVGKPFWLAGSYGSPEKVREALALGAAGVQVGTAFAFCNESGLDPRWKSALIAQALEGKARVFTDPIASPTGFPFKVAELEGSASEAAVYEERTRICDLGFLREAYMRTDGSLGYRCSAEPVDHFVHKGGSTIAAEGRKCLCNALMANIGMEQVRSDGYREVPLVTSGDDLVEIARFCSKDNPTFSAADVIRILLS